MTYNCVVLKNERKVDCHRNETTRTGPRNRMVRSANLTEKTIIESLTQEYDSLSGNSMDEVDGRDALKSLLTRPKSPLPSSVTRFSTTMGFSDPTLDSDCLIVDSTFRYFYGQVFCRFYAIRLQKYSRSFCIQCHKM